MLREGSADGVANGNGESRRLSLHSPWSSVVRGENSSATASSPVDDNFLFEDWVVRSDNNGGGTAWNRPPNDPIPAVMGGGTASWPELSLSTRPAIISDGSPQQAPIISQPPQRSANSSGVNGNHGNSSANNPNPASPRPPKNRGGGGGNSSGTGPSQSTFNQPSPSMPPHAPYGKIHAGRGSTPMGGFGASPSHSGNDHSSQRSNSRRNNYGPRSRGDGQYHNHGGMRDQDRREVHHLPQYVPPPPMGYMPPPLSLGVSTYMAPPPMRGFPGQIGFDMPPRPPPNFYFPHMAPETFRAMPIVTRQTPMTPMDPLTNMIINQVDFYFSDDNLARDYFLKSNMDDNGWVPASLIASFRRVQFLTKDIPLILESLRYSMVVEVQGDKVRRRNEWSKWVLSTNISGS